MGNNFPIVSILLLAICFPAAVFVSTSKIPPVRKEMYKGRENQLERAYFPGFGVDKFYADTQWIVLVQEMAHQSASTPEKDGKRLPPEEEKKVRAEQMKYFYDRFDRLSDLDPNNQTYYLFGARFLQNDLPQEAMALLRKGDVMMKDPDWSFPFTQYHIIRTVLVGFDNPKGEKEHLDQMTTLLKQAMDRPNSPAHIQTKWLNLQAIKHGFASNEIGRLQLWARYYLDKIQPAIVEPVDPVDPAAGAKDKKAAPKKGKEPIMAPVMNPIDSAAEATLRDTILQMAQKLALENWQQQNKAANDKEKAELAKQHKVISDVFFQIAPSGHYSPVSLQPYAAGDLYDVLTGTPVVPYGVDPDMLQKGIIVIYKGDFSQATGKPRVSDEEIAKRFKAGELKIPADAK